MNSEWRELESDPGKLTTRASTREAAKTLNTHTRSLPGLFTLLVRDFGELYEWVDSFRRACRPFLFV